MIRAAWRGSAPGAGPDGRGRCRTAYRRTAGGVLQGVHGRSRRTTRSARAKRDAATKLIDADFMAVVIASMKGKTAPEAGHGRLRHLYRAVQCGLHCRDTETMAELLLPKNSQIKPGKTWPKPAGATRLREYRVYRYDPDSGENPRIDTYFVDLDDCGPMVLDALLWIKNKVDPTLTLRRSCREGICGSCSMNIDGAQHAGLHQGHGRDRRAPISDLSAAAHAGDQGPGAGPLDLLRPAPLDRAVAEDHDADAATRSGCSRKPDREKLDGLYECILCACCSTSCPSYWWNGEKYLGPAVLLQAYRWLIDSRDEATERAARQSRGPVQALSLPHHHELRQDLPEGPEPGQGDRRDQEDDGRAASGVAPFPNAGGACSSWRPFRL